jgi:hypothetical protein
MEIALSTWLYTAAVGVKTRPYRQTGLTVKKKSLFKRQHTFALNAIIILLIETSYDTIKHLHFFKNGVRSA